MNIEEWLKGMAKELDKRVDDYNAYDRPELKKQLYYNFETTVMSFNAVLANLFGHDEMEKVKFPRQTDEYIKLRKGGKW